MRKLLYLVITSLLTAATACGGKQEPVKAPEIITDSAAKVPVKEALALGRVEPQAKIVALASEMSGVVAEIYVQEGQTLKAGQPLLTLSHSVKDAETALAESRLATKKSQIKADEASLEENHIQAANYKRTCERLSRLAAQGAETRQSVDDAETAFKKQEAELKRLAENLDVSRNQLRELQTEVALNRAERERLTVKAPSAGVLLSLDAKTGAQLATGTSIGDFAPESPLTVLCEVDELYADRIATGSQAILRNQGSTAMLAKGKVIYAAPYLKKKSLFSDAAGDAEDRRVREVRIVIEQGKPLLINSRLEAVIQLSTTGNKASE